MACRKWVQLSASVLKQKSKLAGDLGYEHRLNSSMSRTCLTSFRSAAVSRNSL